MRLLDNLQIYRQRCCHVETGGVQEEVSARAESIFRRQAAHVEWFIAEAGRCSHPVRKAAGCAGRALFCSLPWVPVSLPQHHPPHPVVAFTSGEGEGNAW